LLCLLIFDFSQLKQLNFGLSLALSFSLAHAAYVDLLLICLSFRLESVLPINLIEIVSSASGNCRINMGMQFPQPLDPHSTFISNFPIINHHRVELLPTIVDF